MRTVIPIAAVAAASLALGTGVATAGPSGAAAKRAEVYRLGATLVPVPHAKGAARARGSFSGSITINGKTGTLRWKLSFSRLSGAATAAGVQLAGRTIIPLCAPCRSGKGGSFSGPLGGNSQILQAILGGRTAVSVSTRRNPKGELRGTLHASSTAAAQAVVSTRKVAGLGQVLVDGKGLTLYMFVPDKRRKVTCVGTCAVVWPPLKLAAGQKPVAKGGAKAKLLGSDPDPQGGRVVTYDGWPLYTYIADKAPGQAKGQALNLNGGLWYVLSPAGKLIRTKPHGSGGYG